MPARLLVALLALCMVLAGFLPQAAAGAYAAESGEPAGEEAVLAPAADEGEAAQEDAPAPEDEPVAEDEPAAEEIAGEVVPAGPPVEIPPVRTTPLGYGEVDLLEVIPIEGTVTISAGGVYKLAAGVADAVITIDTTEPVTIVGNGVGDGSKTNANMNCAIIAAVSGVQLTIEDVYISRDNLSYDVVDFSSGAGTLTIAGTNMLEYDGGYGNNAAIHIAPTSSLLINGTGTLYVYKNQAGSAIGGRNAEANGAITFDGPTLFVKGTKQGAVIGTGANAKGNTPGDITFLSGEYTIIANARGALIGGGAGSDGGAAGGTVYIRGGTFNFNVDYSGAAIGGGGFDKGNDASGGKVYITGGSLRVYIDYNAVDPNGNGLEESGDTLWAGVTQPGVNDAAITAEKLNVDDEPVSMLVFDTKDLKTQADTFDATIDDVLYYTGGKHSYKFVNEDLQKQSQIPISNTTTNWTALTDETKLYFYATEEDHTLFVNDEEFAVTWNEDLGKFEVAPAGEEEAGPDPDVWDGSVDVRWYDPDETVFHLSEPSQLAGLAAIVNGIYNTDAVLYGDEAFVTGTYSGGTSGYWFGIDSFMGKTVYLDADLDMGGVKGTDGKWSGPNYMPIGGQYSMQLNESSTLLSSSFCGNLDGQGHKVFNIYCERASMNPSSGAGNPEPFKESQSVGLIGRLGTHDNDPANLHPYNPSVKNVIVDGYISARRSVGGIVGKMGKTQYNDSPRPEGAIGCIVENCANYAEVHGTDAKGTAGIVGAAWNGGIIKNCYNAGAVTSTYTNATAGIAGSNEIKLVNCYNVGVITMAGSGQAASIASNNGGGSYENCYWLIGTAPIGNYGTPALPADAAKTADEMKTQAFLDALNAGGNAFIFKEGENNGFPVLNFEQTEEPPVDEPVTGDIDGDGITTISDAVFLISAILSGQELTEEQFALADVDGDGVLTMTDVLQIIQIVLLS
jgi:hypothetical protein